MYLGLYMSGPFLLLSFLPVVPLHPPPVAPPLLACAHYQNKSLITQNRSRS